MVVVYGPWVSKMYSPIIIKEILSVIPIGYQDLFFLSKNVYLSKEKLYNFLTFNLLFANASSLDQYKTWDKTEAQSFHPIVSCLILIYNVL